MAEPLPQDTLDVPLPQDDPMNVPLFPPGIERLNTQQLLDICWPTDDNDVCNAPPLLVLANSFEQPSPQIEMA